jgi:hypothetical protein
MSARPTHICERCGNINPVPNEEPFLDEKPAFDEKTILDSKPKIDTEVERTKYPRKIIRDGKEFDNTCKRTSVLIQVLER